MSGVNVINLKHTLASLPKICFTIFLGIWKNLQLFVGFYLKAHSQSETIFNNWKPFKIEEKCLFLLKRAFVLKIS